MQVKIIIGTVAFMLTMVLFGFYSLLEPQRLQNFTEARLGRQIEAGAEIYYANCTTCHGINGLGQNGGECLRRFGSPRGERIARARAYIAHLRTHSAGKRCCGQLAISCCAAIDARAKRRICQFFIQRRLELDLVVGER